MPRALEGVAAQCDAPQWQLWPNGSCLLAHVNGVAHTGAPQPYFSKGTFSAVVTVWLAAKSQHRSNPGRVRIRYCPACHHARIDTPGDEWPQEEITVVDIIGLFSPSSLALISPSHRSHVCLLTMLHIGVPSCPTPWGQLLIHPSLVAYRVCFRQHPSLSATDRSSSSSDLDALGHAVGLARVDLLARLGDGGEHLLVGQVLLGHDGGGLALEGDLVRLDACRWW